MNFRCTDQSSSKKRPDLFSAAFVLFILMTFMMAASPAGADILIKTKDGKSFSWPNFTLEDNNYCTQLEAGLFCIPVSDIASAREVASTQAAERYSKTTPMVSRSSKGKIITETESGSFDGRSNYRGGRGYGSGDVYGNTNRSSTSIEREVTDQDIRNFERDKWMKEQAAEERQQRMEQDRQADEARRRQEAERNRRENEAARQRAEAERNARRPFW